MQSLAAGRLACEALNRSAVGGATGDAGAISISQAPRVQKWGRVSKTCWHLVRTAVSWLVPLALY